MTETLTIRSDSPEQTRLFGRILGQGCFPGCVIGLIGELGAGKTELVKGIATGLGIDPNEVTSPTYVLINEYQGDLPLFHFDFYRLEMSVQLDNIGAEEYLWGEGVCVVEWADLFPNNLPKNIVTVRIEKEFENLRTFYVKFQPTSRISSEKIVQALQSTSLGVIYN